MCELRRACCLPVIGPPPLPQNDEPSLLHPLMPVAETWVSSSPPLSHTQVHLHNLHGSQSKPLNVAYTHSTQGNADVCVCVCVCTHTHIESSSCVGVGRQGGRVCVVYVLCVWYEMRGVEGREGGRLSVDGGGSLPGDRRVAVCDGWNPLTLSGG